ncbi:MAG TPA: hypothetical protein VJB14_02800, partial [Planctomycetota bacterium]|nr:hypothetical protein [Planctomycetota bacterium]
GGSPFRFKREYVSETTLEGTIEDADDKSFKITLKNGEGTFQKNWAQFDGAGFVTFVRKQWKYSPQQNSDPNDRCDLAAVCMEFGLYEEAMAEIREVLEAMKNPTYPVTDSVRKFCEDYSARLPKGESAEFSEVEAQKRLDRVEAFMKSASYAEARSEIDLLRGRTYGRTQAVQDANPRIEEHLLEIMKKGGEQLNKARREEKLQKLLDRVAEEQSAVKKGQQDVVARLSRVDDPFQRNVHLGTVYGASGDLRGSTDRYSEAKRVAEAMLMRKEVGREFWPTLGLVYAELFRNAIVAKDRTRAQALKNEASARFVDSDTKMEEKWWSDLRGALEAWSENVYPQEEKRIARLRDDVRASADDPQKVWTLAVSLMDSLGNLFEARGYFAYLLETHPEFSQVQNGNCIYRIAEIHFAAREIPQAIKRYAELIEQNREHPKVVDTGSSSGVKRRLDDCYKLLNRMGYAREKGGK